MSTRRQKRPEMFTNTASNTTMTKDGKIVHGVCDYPGCRNTNAPFGFGWHPTWQWFCAEHWLARLKEKP